MSRPAPPAAFPAVSVSARDWQVYGVQTRGQLVIANGRTSDVSGITRACEGWDAESVREIERPWCRRILPD